MSTGPARIHETAIVEDGVVLGDGTSVWDNAHLRGPCHVGADCIIGGKSYIAYGVTIADRVKVNAFVYLCHGVTLETGVFVGAGTVFTNDRFPRACDAELQELLTSAPTEDTLETTVREGATIGARATIGPGITIGRFAMVGMGAVVTRSVGDFHMVAGHPVRAIGYVCRCGQPIARFNGDAPDIAETTCACGRRYAARDGVVSELVALGATA